MLWMRLSGRYVGLAARSRLLYDSVDEAYWRTLREEHAALDQWLSRNLLKLEVHQVKGEGISRLTTGFVRGGSGKLEKSMVPLRALS